MVRLHHQNGAHLAAAIAVAAVVAIGCSAENTPVAEMAATAAATHWLHSVDVDSLDLAYSDTGAILRERRPKNDWIENIEGARSQLGSMLDRRLENRRYENTPEGFPEGSYVIVTYTTDFTNQEKVEELVVMRLDEGIWRPERYLIDPDR